MWGLLDSLEMKRARLRDGTLLWSDEPLGVSAVWDEIESYFLDGDKVQPGDVVFDVGANIGLFSLAAFRQSGGMARIWSFEPIASTCAVAEANARLFDPSGAHWQTVRAGLGRVNEIAVLNHFPRLSVLSGRFRGPEQAKRELDEFLAQERVGAPFEFANVFPVSVRRALGQGIGSLLLKSRPVAAQIWTLSSALQKLGVERVHWLKIDVEGAELDVLRGVEPQDWARIGRIVCEIESVAMLDEAVSLLESVGFTVEVRDNHVMQGQELKIVFAQRL
ncbi:FkbM family methyltransferase [bacterium]|nr:MAG: FkbM family methyltransferase [bacterium]